MANEEHLAILRQGAKVWNEWRQNNEGIIPDLSRADLTKFDLIGINLNMAILLEANLFETSLFGANLHKAYLYWARLIGSELTKADLTEATLVNASMSITNLTGAKLRDANLTGAKLRDANLTGAILYGANLDRTNLAGANLDKANLFSAKLYETNLIGADFAQAILGHTSFSNIDLSAAKNLHLVEHPAPSSIDIDTILKSKGKIPIMFLEGCGVPKHIIDNMAYLVDIPTIQYYSCFISYSTKDEGFANQLNDRMKRDGLRVWFAPEEIKGGQKIHEQIYDAIRYHDKLIIVLSEASMSSAWVETEIKNAKEQERETKRRKLFPISLVSFEKIEKWKLFDADDGRDLAREIREFYIPDFSNWKDYDSFNREFEKLLKALRAEE